jgi:hypothetical protein
VNFLMYGENTKYHSNPYIQGTTVPCDTYMYMHKEQHARIEKSILALNGTEQAMMCCEQHA